MPSKTKKPLVRFYAQDIVNALAKRYSTSEWAFFPQVRNSTGLSSSPRTADAVALNLWPSRGMELHGFEVKTKGTWVGNCSGNFHAQSFQLYAYKEHRHTVGWMFTLG